MKYDVIIIGAGPGGLKAAEILANNNKKVLVLEKNNIIGKKVCAAGLTLKDLKFIPKSLIECSFNKIIINTPIQKTIIKSNKPFVFTTNRIKLGKYMAKKALNAGAEIKRNTFVTKIKDSSIIANKKEIKFDYLIGADGATSIVRKSLGIKTNNILIAMQYITNKKFKDMEFFLNTKKFGPAYAWIFPYNNTTSIGTGAINKIIKIQKLKQNLDEFCKDKFNIEKAEFQSHPINHDYQGHEFKNKFLIGCAAGFTSSITGEGIYQAITSGYDIANKITNPSYNYKYINTLIKKKKLERKLFNLITFNKLLTSFLIEMGILTLKTRLGEKIVSKISKG